MAAQVSAGHYVEMNVSLSFHLEWTAIHTLLQITRLLGTPGDCQHRGLNESIRMRGARCNTAMAQCGACSLVTLILCWREDLPIVLYDPTCCADDTGILSVVFLMHLHPRGVQNYCSICSSRIGSG